MSTFDIIIVGGGVMGTATAYTLSRRAHKVLLFDQFDVPNQWSISGDHARSIRLSYGKDTFFTELARQSLNLWKEIEKDVKEELFIPTGILDIAHKDHGPEEASLKTLQSLGIEAHRMGPMEVRERFRIFSPRGMRYAVFHPEGGLLWAQKAVKAFAAAAQRRGCVIRKDSRVASVVAGPEGIKEIRDQEGRAWRAPIFMFMPGPWTKQLLSSYRLPLTVTRQRLLYFRPPSNQGRYRPQHCPIFISRDKGLCGFPVHIHGFMKLEQQKLGNPAKPGSAVPDSDPRFERACRAFLKKTIPDLGGFSEIEGKVCYYNNTRDGDFIIDKLPKTQNAYIATGFGAHGFTFAPLVANLMLELMSNGKTALNLNRFRASRFRG